MENKDDAIPFPQKAANHATKNCTKDGQSLSDREGGFKVGAKCMVFVPARKKNVSDKLSSGWSGPFIISKKLSETLYKVRAGPDNGSATKPLKRIISLSRMRLVERDDTTSEGQSSTLSNDNEESDTTSEPDTPTRPSQPHPSPEGDEIDTQHFPREYEDLYESRDEESTSSKNNNASYHDKES